MAYVDKDKLPYIFAKAINEFDDTFVPISEVAIKVGQIILNLPTADVVEVVRCKDCKYGEVDDDDFPHQRFCRYSGCDWNHEYHYCGYGERGEK